MVSLLCCLRLSLAFNSAFHTAMGPAVELGHGLIEMYERNVVILAGKISCLKSFQPINNDGEKRFVGNAVLFQVDELNRNIVSSVTSDILYVDSVLLRGIARCYIFTRKKFWLDRKSVV